MAFNKIQPKQFQLPTFSSASGNLLFTDNSTGVTVELNSSITGSVDFVGDLTHEGSIIAKASSNTVDNGTGNAAIGNEGALTLKGTNNTVVGGSVTALSGQLNSAINALECSHGSGTYGNTVVGGGSIIVSNETTGSVGLFSSNFGQTMSLDQTVYIGGNSGIRMLSDTDHFGTTTFNDIVTFDTETKFYDNLLLSGASVEFVFTGYSGSFAASNEIHFKTDVVFDDVVEFDGQATFNQAVVLSDSSDAASEQFVNDRVRTRMDTGLSTTLYDQLTGTGANQFGLHTDYENLENVLSGTNTLNIVGRLLTGTVSGGSETKPLIVYTTNGFTGYIQLDSGYYG